MLLILAISNIIVLAISTFTKYTLTQVYAVAAFNILIAFLARVTKVLVVTQNEENSDAGKTE